MFLFLRFWGMRGDNSCNVFLLLFMVLWGPISATLCRRAVLMLWHASLFLGLWSLPHFSSFCLVASAAFSCKKKLLDIDRSMTFLSNRAFDDSPQNHTLILL
jgi:hypothetical protein